VLEGHIYRYEESISWYNDQSELIWGLKNTLEEKNAWIEQQAIQIRKLQQEAAVLCNNNVALSAYYNFDQDALITDLRKQIDELLEHREVDKRIINLLVGFRKELLETP
jgi:hypothetical protein